ncbi:MAG: leucyl/phenylalanyl-tRNA--protein transferase [Burkholderiales bacterium]
MIPWLKQNSPFPPVDSALQTPNGLLAAGADLSPKRLIDAYSHGIFPWYSEGQPILWWSPDPRMVLAPQEFKISRSLAKSLRNKDYVLRFDSAFREVMLACSEPRGESAGTWISPDMVAAYYALHELGYAHSVETWVDGRLAGGLYGVAIGKMFFGESMFARRTDASKIALAHLVQHLIEQDFGLIDCQMSTAHLASLGAREIPRNKFMNIINKLCNKPGAAKKWSDVLVRVETPSGVN